MTDRLMRRFRGKVHKTDSCWLWTGATKKTGYGRFKIGKKVKAAHRVSYEIHVGPIPEGHHIDHTCRTRDCVNPAHLEAVSPNENQRRRRERGRAVAG